MTNPLLLTDVYKMGHMEQYPEGTQYVYSYLEARVPDKYIIFFGIRYIFEKYLSQPITQEHVDEVIKLRTKILGNTSQDVIDKYNSLIGDKLPITILAPEEGTIFKTQTPMLTIFNNKRGFGWVVGYVESLILKLWNTCTVATQSAKYYCLMQQYAELTCEDNKHVPFQVHDFGYRGCSSEETAALSGMAHLMVFNGSDNVPAISLINNLYNWQDEHIGNSIPASEHSVMCSYNHEIEAIEMMLDKYPNGMVSIVSDSFDYFKVLTEYLPQLKDKILSRNGGDKVVIRPDSGNPYNILLGDFKAPLDTPESKGTFEILWDLFGGHINDKGYKVLHQNIGVIYGDGMTFHNISRILEGMKKKGFASENLVIGVGGLLLQRHNRDDFGFAVKATAIQVNGKFRAIKKDPKTDPGKVSKTGLFHVYKPCQWDHPYPFHSQLVDLDRVISLKNMAQNLSGMFFNNMEHQFYSAKAVRENIHNNLKSIGYNEFLKRNK